MKHPSTAAATAALLLAAGLLAGSPEADAEPTARNGAFVTRWASGLAGPQGLARNASGDVLVAEHDAGRVARFGVDGTSKGILATGLQAPSWARFHQGALFVSERKGNSVARVDASGTVTRLPGEVIDPLGIIADPGKTGSLLVLSHRQSVVRRFAWDGSAKRFTLETEPVLSPMEGAKYGWRDVVLGKDGTWYVTDEVSRSVLRRKPGGAVEEWVKGLSSPSGLAFSPRGDLYLTEEGGGRVSRVGADGTVVVLAEGLGAARAILFLDDRTMLVSDRRGGDVWKIVLPQ